MTIKNVLTSQLSVFLFLLLLFFINPLTPNDPYSGPTAPLTSKRCIFYIYSKNTVTEYFKHGIYSPFLSLQNAVSFIILTYLVPVLFTFYIQDVLKFKRIIPAPNVMQFIQYERTDSFTFCLILHLLTFITIYSDVLRVSLNKKKNEFSPSF